MTDQPKWTPGDWAGKGQTSEDAVFCGTMHRICADGAWLAFVPAWKDNPDEASEAEANAHLIAAAPDLYAALERLVDAVSGLSAGVASISADARAALAKARGQA